MFADSQNKGPSPRRVETDRYMSPQYSQKIIYFGKPWSDGHISLKQFDIFQFGLSYTLYKILDFNFATKVQNCLASAQSGQRLRYSLSAKFDS